MKQPVLVSALLAWAAAASLMIAWAFIMGGVSSGHDLDVPVLLYVFWTGIFAVPACLIAGFLVNQYLPSSSPYWQSKRAALLGSICGFSIMGMIVIFLSGDLNIFHSDGWIACVLAAATGAVCGLSLARFKQKSPELEPPSSHQ